MLTVASSTSLNANWSQPNSTNGVITGYTVYCNSSLNQTYPALSSGDMLESIAVDADTTMASIYNLTAFTSYDCHVTANTSIGEGEASQRVSEVTSEARTYLRFCVISVPS